MIGLISPWELCEAGRSPPSDPNYIHMGAVYVPLTVVEVCCGHELFNAEKVLPRRRLLEYREVVLNGRP